MYYSDRAWPTAATPPLPYHVPHVVASPTAPAAGRVAECLLRHRPPRALEPRAPLSPPHSNRRQILAYLSRHRASASPPLRMSSNPSPLFISEAPRASPSTQATISPTPITGEPYPMQESASSLSPPLPVRTILRWVLLQFNLPLMSLLGPLSRRTTPPPPWLIGAQPLTRRIVVLPLIRALTLSRCSGEFSPPNLAERTPPPPLILSV
jgi:hypothetical protein